MAALGRIAGNNHPIKLTAGDTVVFSSKQIPGNEIAIGRIQNQLAEAGVQMVTDRQALIHVSGHPGRPELAAMRSEEHTSELQSLMRISYAVFCLNKKKKKQ